MKTDYKALCVKNNEIQEKWNALSEQSHSWRTKDHNLRTEVKRKEEEVEGGRTDEDRQIKKTIKEAIQEKEAGESSKRKSEG